MHSSQITTSQTSLFLLAFQESHPCSGPEASVCWERTDSHMLDVSFQIVQGIWCMSCSLLRKAITLHLIYSFVDVLTVKINSLSHFLCVCSVWEAASVQLPAVQVDSTKPGGLQPHRWQSELITHDATKGFHFTCTQAVFFNCTCVGVCSVSRRRAWWPWTSQEKLEDGSSRIRWRPSVQSGRRDRPGGWGPRAGSSSLSLYWGQNMGHFWCNLDSYLFEMNKLKRLHLQTHHLFPFL